MKLRLFLCVALCAGVVAIALPAVAVSQDDDVASPSLPTTDPRFESPRSTMFTFLEAIHGVREWDTDQWRAVTDCFDFSDSGITPGTEASREVARDLWGALNRIRPVAESHLPDADDIGSETQFVFFPREFDAHDEALRTKAGLEDEKVELVRGSDGSWRFSAATVRSASSMYEALAPGRRVVDDDETALDTQPFLRRWIPAALTSVAFLDIEVWQWFGLVVLAFLGMVVDFLVRRIARRITRGLTGRFGVEAEGDDLAGFARPIGLLALSITWLVSFRSLGFPNTAEDILLAAIRTFTALAAMWSFWRLADLVGDIFIRARGSESNFVVVLVPMVRKSFKTVSAAFGVVYVANSLQINIVPLLTGLGIGGVAFAFAAKDTIENFFGSAAVILDRPFEVGDWIVVGDVEGTVEELGFRSTRVRTFYNSQFTIPNATFLRSTIDNYGRREFRRWKTTIGVQYDTSPDKMIAFAEGIRELVRTHPYTRKDYFQVWFNGFGASSLDLLLYVFHRVPDWSTELRERERLLIDIVRLADRLGVEFAFPTQTLHMFQEEQGERGPVHDPPGATTDQRAMREGIRIVRELTADASWRKQTPPAVTYGDPTV